MSVISLWQRWLRSIFGGDLPDDAHRGISYDASDVEIRDNVIIRGGSIVWTDHKPENWGCPE